MKTDITIAGYELEELEEIAHGLLGVLKKFNSKLEGKDSVIEIKLIDQEGVCSGRSATLYHKRN